MQELWKYYEQFVRRAERDAALNNVQGVGFLVDWDGFALKSYASGLGNHILIPA